VLIQNIENLVATLVGWMRSYQFDPCAVELDFGFDESKLPGWRIDLGSGRELLLRGRIDRIDMCKQEGGRALAVVMDYKSSPRKLDATKLHHGLELQLLSYLGLLRQVTPAGDLPKLDPVGAFYVGLRGSYKAAGSREQPLDDAEARHRLAFQHSGRYSETCYPQLDREKLGEQFATHHASRNAVAGADFPRLIDDVEKHLRDFGRRILDGAVEIAPYRKGSETACDYCEFHPVCRFDSWTEPFRKLQPPPKKPKPEKEPKSRGKKAEAP
jgi:ATP-dependent helicase/nuclease subunit B